MMMYRFILLLLLFTGFTVNAQDLLTPEDAVAIALKNNYDIKLAANDLEIDRQNVSLANAGLLPALTGNLAQNNSVQNSTQVRADGTQQELDNAKNNNLSYGVNLGWTIFDGFRMFARYDQLKEFEKQGGAQLKLTILTRVSDVMTTYYNLVQQQQLLTSLDTAIVISSERVTTAENRFTIGKASKLEVLNAQVDLNTDQTNFLRQKESYQNTKTFLNELMARELTTDFRVADSVSIDSSLKLDELILLSGQQNPQIQLALINKRIAELNFKQVRSQRYPQIGISTGYVFNESESSLGFARSNSAQGFNYGISASINIFNGFLQKRNENIARLNIANNDLLLQQQTLSVNSQLMAAYQTYLTNLQLVELEGRNEAIAKQNLDITLAKYKIGTIDTLEFRTAQLNYVNAMARNSIAKYNAKVSEIALKELAGNITF